MRHFVLMAKKRKASPKLKLCDNLWSRLVKVRAGFKCEHCWKTDKLNSHHLFTRTNYSTRFDLDNGICLCAGCHTMSSKFSAHWTPMIFDEWIISERWQDRYDRLKFKINQVRDSDYDKIEKYLIDETNKLLAE